MYLRASSEKGHMISEDPESHMIGEDLRLLALVMSGRNNVDMIRSRCAAS